MNQCSDKLTERVASHLPLHLDTFLREHSLSSNKPVVLAGGAIRDIVCGDKPKDYDLWLSSHDYGGEIHGWLSQLSKGCPIIETNNSVGAWPYQFITRWRWDTDPAALLDEFDFTSSKWVYYYYSDADELPMLLCGDFTYNDTLARVLDYDPPYERDEVPDGSLRRAFRLVARGWKITPSSIIPLAARAMHGDGQAWRNAVDKWYTDNPRPTQTPNVFY